MSAERIRQALQSLNAKMDKLEKDFEVKAKALKAGTRPTVSSQHDLFQAPSAILANPKGQVANDASAAILARKLDRAIERVQGLLKEEA